MINCDAPQGSILGPLLFIFLYVPDMAASVDDDCELIFVIAVKL